MHCWPDSNWQTTSDTGEQNVGLVESHSKKTSVRSFRSLCQDVLFPALLSSDGPPDLKLLDKPMLFRGFTRDMQQYLIEHAEALAKSPAAVQILQKAFAGEKGFDFTPFQGKIAEDDLASLANSEALRDVKTLNLSGFDSIPDSKHIVSAIPHLGLDNLYLLSRPDRSSDRASQMMTMIMSLAKCSRKPFISQKLVLGPAFSQSLQARTWLPWIHEIGSCCWDTFPVIQLLFQGFREYRSGFHFALTPRAPDITKNWLADFFLGDALLTPVRFVTGLLTIIKSKFQEPQGPAMTPWELYVPLMFACAPSSLNTLQSSTEVSPIPAEALSRIKDQAQLCEVPARDIHPVGWTAIMIQSPIEEAEDDDRQFTKTRFQVALVRSKGPPNYRALRLQEVVANPDRLELVDLKEFLELTAPAQAGDLANCLSELTAWAQIDGELIGKMTVDEAVSVLQNLAERPGGSRMGERLVTRSSTKRRF
ncbi:hypothetical protein N8I77_009577 [Diaporthe amygdali]|uniref:Uncharacterized protein n=1 Tax=Phomopsis amygdali TaxID=1214568 RepID=A0AAD9W0L9_PHOAM|nr:hypothetical protein N8I77_009577 [Diaporthe amygdali]